MENDFTNLTAKVWENLDNPINFLHAAFSGGTLLQYVMSHQNNCLMELYTNFTKFDFSWKSIFHLLLYLSMLRLLKHKDSFGKSENLSKLFFAKILVFDHDYEGNSLSSNGLLWISFIFLYNLFELFFELFGGPSNKSIHVINYTLQGVIIIKSLI